jgi:hypothetical protein
MRSGLLGWLDRASAEAWQTVVAVVLCLLFPALAALALWPAGRAAFGLLLLKGFGLFWLVVLVAHTLLTLIHKRLRVDLYSHPDAFVVSNVLVSGMLMLGWTAFAALAALDAAAGAGRWLTCGLYFAGFLSGVVACQVLGALFSGHIYKFACLVLACAGFAAFAAWPGAARAVFGWFFGLF